MAVAAPLTRHRRAARTPARAQPILTSHATDYPSAPAIFTRASIFPPPLRLASSIFPSISRDFVVASTSQRRDRSSPSKPAPSPLIAVQASAVTAHRRPSHGDETSGNDAGSDADERSRRCIDFARFRADSHGDETSGHGADSDGDHSLTGASRNGLRPPADPLFDHWSIRCLTTGQSVV